MGNRKIKGVSIFKPCGSQILINRGRVSYACFTLPFLLPQYHHVLIFLCFPFVLPTPLQHSRIIHGFLFLSHYLLHLIAAQPSSLLGVLWGGFSIILNFLGEFSSQKLFQCPHKQCSPILCSDFGGRHSETFTGQNSSKEWLRRHAHCRMLFRSGSGQAAPGTGTVHLVWLLLFP